MKTLVPAAFFLLPPVPVDHPLSRDRTGILRRLPFRGARARAQRGGPLLLVEPVAFGTTDDGGG